MSIHRITRIPALVALAASLAAAEPPATPASQEPGFTTTREFSSRLFLVQHRSPVALQEALRPLGSGFKGALLESIDRDGVRALSVRDFPENLAAMEEALKRLDLPAPSRREVELYIHVFFASTQEAPAEPVPDEMKEVLSSLRSTLNYRSYTPVAAFLQRASVGMDSVTGNGMRDMTLKGPKGEPTSVPLRFTWIVGAIRHQAGPDGLGTFAVENFRFMIQEGTSSREARLQTPLTLKDGEKVVVGTSTYGDRGVIVVVAAKAVK